MRYHGPVVQFQFCHSILPVEFHQLSREIRSALVILTLRLRSMTLELASERLPIRYVDPHNYAASPNHRYQQHHNQQSRAAKIDPHVVDIRMFVRRDRVVMAIFRVNLHQGSPRKTCCSSRSSRLSVISCFTSSPCSSSIW